MRTLIIVLMTITVLSLYSTYTSFQHSMFMSIELKQLKQMIELKEGELIRYSTISKKALNEKLKLQNKSAKLTEQLNEALNNNKNKCANQLVDSVISGKLYSRAAGLRSTT